MQLTKLKLQIEEYNQNHNLCQVNIQSTTN
jgi:hypothetical protein